MTTFGYIYYAALTGAAGISVFFAYTLQNKYKLKFLSDYFYYLIAINFYWFVVLVVPDLLISILNETLENVSPMTYWLFVLFSYPCLLVGLYLFLALFVHLRTDRIPASVPWIFIITMVLFGIGLGITLKLSMDSFDSQLIGNYNLFLKVVALIIRYGAIVYALIGSFRLKDGLRKRLIRVLCWYFSVSFALYYFLMGNLPSSESIVAYLNLFLYLFINNLPLFYLGGFFKKNFSQYLLPQQNNVEFDKISLEFGLTNREKEIFLLMMKGKTNKEIGEELYISTKTARNHVYNIFQKFGVNNRTKFFIFVSHLANNR